MIKNMKIKWEKPKTPDWISVADRLPDMNYTDNSACRESKRVLVYISGGQLCIASFIKNKITGEQGWYCNGHTIDNVTHWSPLENFRQKERQHATYHEERMIGR